MTKRKTTAEFVADAKSIWGDRFIYDCVDYVDGKKPVDVICPIEGHGSWPCLPSLHTRKIKPRGCPACGGSKPSNTEEFKRRARKVHGQKYDYTKVKYLNARTNVTITCGRHYPPKLFPQSPDQHLRGQGCRFCRDKKARQRFLLSEAEVNERLKNNSKGGGFCELIEGSYRGQNKKAQIVCEKHGAQKPRFVTSILSGEHPCLECSGNFIYHGYTEEQFREKIEEKFNGKNYTILPFVYSNRSDTLISLFCHHPNHGRFSLFAGSLRNSPGCFRCSYKESQKNRTAGLHKQLVETEQKRFNNWLKNVTKKYNGFYDYSKVEYKNQRTDVIIICPKHGEFKKTPDEHKSAGCSLCAYENTFGLYSERYFELNPKSKFAPATLYYLKFSFADESWYKVGVTTTSIKMRFNAAPKTKIKYEVLGQLTMGLHDAWILEDSIQKQHGEQFRYRPLLNGLDTTPRDWRLGPSECFSKPLDPKFSAELFSKNSFEQN